MRFMARVLRRFGKLGGTRGFTMLEMITVLAVVATMAAALSPMVLNYLDDAKKIRAESDVKALAAVILNLTRDVRHLPMYLDGTQTTGEPDIKLLRGPGNDPIDNAKPWLSTEVDELENHLVKNAPGANTPNAAVAKKYATDGRFAHRAPYIDKITEDPWGNRYLVNIVNGNPSPGDKIAKVIYALSAGPNGIIETNPDAPADSGPTLGGDDIAVRIR